SLLATQAVSRMRDVFEVEIPLRTMFENPTVEAFSTVLEGIEAPGAVNVRTMAEAMLEGIAE
ncbi:phosphopantetheine-binding protein, partial [Streptomyces yangpuensis]|uniref:phosphopantetheine-binding protein n=1 Tax=Streptomyces yangpuensis TaxID=1648182 RepID=UPI00382470E9